MFALPRNYVDLEVLILFGVRKHFYLIYLVLPGICSRANLGAPYDVIEI